MNTIYLLLGSNEGNRVQWLDQCLQQLGCKAGNIIATSDIYETAAWGLEDQPDFLNMAVGIETELSPAELLESIQGIEKDLGRQRTLKWGQRTLDIDILFFNNAIIDQPNLKVPHPYLHERRFALAPLKDIAGDLVHPVLTHSISTLFDICPDPLPVKLFKEKSAIS